MKAVVWEVQQALDPLGYDEAVGDPKKINVCGDSWQ